MGHLIGAKILSALEYDDFLNMEYILCPPGAGPFDTIISDIRCSEILNKMERDVDRNIMFVRRDFEIKYKKKPNISGIVHIVKTHKALCEGYIQPKASFRTCRSVSYPEIFLGHDYIVSDSRILGTRERSLPKRDTNKRGQIVRSGSTVTFYVYKILRPNAVTVMLNQIFSAEYDFQNYQPEFYLYEPFVITIRSRDHEPKQVQIYNMEKIKEDVASPRVEEIIGGLCYGSDEYDKRYRPKLIQERFFSKNHFLPVVFPDKEDEDTVKIAVWHISQGGIKEQWSQIIEIPEEEIEDETTKYELFSRLNFLDSYNWVGADYSVELGRTLIYHIRLDMRRVDSYSFKHEWTDVQAYGYYKDAMYVYIGKEDSDEIPVNERHSLLVKIEEGVPQLMCFLDNGKDGIHLEFCHDGHMQLYYKWEQAPTSGRLIDMDDIEREIRRTTEEHTAQGINRTQTAKIIKLQNLYDEGCMDLDFLIESFRFGNMDRHHRVNFFL